MPKTKIPAPSPKVKVGIPHMPPMYTSQHKKQFLPWTHAEERLIKSRSYWICTARTDGRPHSQAQFYRANGRYASISELLKSSETKNASEMIAAAGNDRTAFGTPEDPLPGYNLRLVVAPDGKAYAMMATKKDGPCRLIGPRLITVASST
jgi:hypothetical protein